MTRVTKQSRDDDQARYAEITKRIAEEVSKRHGRELKPGGYVDDMHVGLRFVEEIDGGRTHSFSFRRNGKTQVRVGEEAKWVTDQRSVGYRQLKAGGYNYEKIADHLVKCADYMKRVYARRKEQNEQRQSDDSFIRSLEKKHNLFSYGGGLSTSEFGGMVFKVTTKDREKAERLVELAIEMGLLTTKKMTTV